MTGSESKVTSTSSRKRNAGEIVLRILAPGRVETRSTGRSGWRPSATNEINLGLPHAPKTTVYGVGSIPTAFGGGEANTSLEARSTGVALSHRA